MDKLFFAFGAGALGGVANVVFLVVAGLVGFPLLLGLELPSFAEVSFLYKQMVWGGLWGLVFVLAIFPKNLVARSVLIAVASTAVVLFIFFPLHTVDGKGPGVAGLNIGSLMPLYVLIANLVYGFAASWVYKYTEK